MSLYNKNVRVLVIEPPNQLLHYERASPNGNLGPAYLIGSMRNHGIEVDYIDATVGKPDTDLRKSFFNKVEMENGNIRYGLDAKEYPEIFCKYDIIATSSIFTAQTRMHFEIAKYAKLVEKQRRKKILTISGGINARALREHFLSNNFDIVALGDGEETIIQIIHQFSSKKPDYSKVERIAFRNNGRTIITSSTLKKGTKFLDHISRPAIEAFPLTTYQKLGIPHAGFPIPGTKFMGLQTSRGCQDKCTFCHISLEKKERDTFGNIGFLRMFSEKRIDKEISDAIKLGITRIYFEDDNLFFSKKRLEKLAPYLKREGLTYSNVNGANLRFLTKRVNNRYETDVDFINMLANFGLNELMMPFETKNQEMMKKYATGKFDPDEMNPIGIVKAVKKAGIRAGSNFLIGFRDEDWQSVLRTKEFAKELFAEGLDQIGFAIPVPFPGTLDFEYEMSKPDVRKDFNENLLQYTDHMFPRGKPLFKTKVPADYLQAAIKDFWLELNSSKFTDTSTSINADKVFSEHSNQV